MSEVLICLALAYAMGWLCKRVGLPSLLGYLAAGFATTAMAPYYTLDTSSKSVLVEVAHIGVILLLFAVGLKLNVKKLVKPEIIGTGVVHFLVSAIIFTPAIFILSGVNGSWVTAFMLAVALSFSSTVLAAKTLESKAELKSFHGRIAIGILIVQDLIAMVFMSIASGEVPSVWAFSVFALPLLRPILFKLMDTSGHDDLFLVAGVLMAVGVGGYGFHAVGLSGELGALVMGALIAKHPKSQELSDRLWSLKELFLIAFFLNIGLRGLPSQDDVIFALVMVALLPIQGLVFFALLLRFKLTARSAFLGSVSLSNYSEFGLIVAAVVLPQWSVPLALAVSLSFLISAPLNRYAHPLFDKMERYLTQFQRQTLHPDEEPCDLADSNVLIMGVGRVGRAAYRVLSQMPENKVIAMDSDLEKVELHAKSGINCVYADAEHGNFWLGLDVKRIKAVVLAMNCPDACVSAAAKLRQSGFSGAIVAHTLYADDAKQILDAGADEAYLTMSEAGESLANHVARMTLT